MISANTDGTRQDSNNLWAFLGSMRFGIWLLVVISILSFVALMIDGLAPLELKQSSVFQLLQLSDPFRSVWFRLLVGLMGVSLVVCVINRGPGLAVEAFRRTFRITQAYFDRNDRTMSYTGEDALTRALGFCKCLHLSVIQKPVENGVAIAASAGSISRLGPLLVHLGMIVLILGGLATGFTGEKTRVSGSSGDTLHFAERGFDILIKDFRIDYYPLSLNQWVELQNGSRGIVKKMSGDSVQVDVPRGNDKFASLSAARSAVRNDFFVSDGHTKSPYQGNIKGYITTAEVIRDNVPLFTREIMVNQPLRYRDLRLYQSSFQYLEGSAKVDSVVVAFHTEASGSASLTLAVKDGEMAIPWNQDVVKLIGFYPDFRLDGQMKPFSASKQLNNPAARLRITHSDGESEEGWVFRGSFGTMGGKIGDYNAHLSDFIGGSSGGSSYMTILDVYRTPGTWLIWLGLFLSSLGLILGYMTYQRQVWGLVTTEGAVTRVSLVWKCSRQSDHFGNSFTECWQQHFS